MKKHFFYILGIALLSGLLSGCYANSHARGTLIIPAETHSHTTTVITHYEPPPHAPAHGHRHHYNGHDLQYDSSFGAYLIIGSPGLYFYDDNYLRFYGGGWQISSRIGGDWHSARRHHVPQRLREHHAQRLRAKQHVRQERHENRHQRQNEHHDGPRHGHRRHHQGHDMTYDADIGAYYIAKRPGIYFYNNRYFRRHGAVWQTANKLNGNWHKAKDQHVPGKLRKKKHRKKERKNHEKKYKNRMH